jgi:hypothetical protein
MLDLEGTQMKGVTMKRVLIVACAGLLALAAPSPAEARTCAPGLVVGLGNWTLTMAGARFSARLAWSRRARALYGFSYGSWLLADNKRYRCMESGIRERCRAIARPCRAGGPRSPLPAAR